MAKRGRRPFKVTLAMRRKVTELISVGMTHDDIARAIGCSTPTLDKNFPEELKTGASVRRAETIALLYKNARSGNLGAQKHLEGLTRAGTAMAELDTMPATDVGKKAEKQAAADRVDGVFAPPEPPKLVVNNS